MIKKPAWLPKTLNLDGKWEDVLERLYGIFKADFINGKPRFEGTPVWWNRAEDPDWGYEEGFWHLISEKDKKTKERIPDFGRAKRLPWCAPLLTNSADPAVTVFEYREASGTVRTYVWLVDLDYLVVLEKQRRTDSSGNSFRVCFLITAYFLCGDSSRRRIRGKYEDRIK